MVDVWLGSYKLFVTQTRFVNGGTFDKANMDTKGKKIMKENPLSHANPSKGGAMDTVINTDDREDSYNVVGSGRSFLDSVLNRNKVDVISVDDNVEGFKHWRSVALVGKVIDFITLPSLKPMMRSQGWSSVGIKYVGGFSVMLVFTGMEEAKCFLGDRNLWSTWFACLSKWDDKYKEVERIAWLQIHRVPIQLAIDQVFDVVGSRFGKVVQSAKRSVDDNNFSYVYVGVLTKSCSRIVDCVDISWRGNLFNVWIDEDVGEWVPDCVEVFDDEEVLDDGNRSNGEEEGFQTVDVDLDRSTKELEMGEIRDNEVVEENAQVLMDGDVDVQDNIEPLTHTFAASNEESTVVRKKFCRRHFFKNRGESSGSHERPKKRQGDDNDPLGWIGLLG
ncbi:hypothetical protein HanPSC8_Chr05g0205851 [Helianthus annuus]|nr:hypothetical protein HanPSC8_Chr05g0205851 [Helianthus annuus]